MANSTPEPWSLSARVAGQQVVQGLRGGILIATLDIHTDEDAANARLIVAAPELLALLRGLDNVVLPNSIEARRRALLAKIEEVR